MNEGKPPPSGAADEARAIAKVPTGIEGVDQILHGGLPEGRLTLVVGGPGTGKTVFGLEFLYRGALAGQPGMFISFEERGEAVRENAATFGWDLAAEEQAGRFYLLEAHVDPETVVSGSFSLKALLALVEAQAKAMGARRVVFDAIDVLLRLFEDPKRERRELYVLNDWLAERGMSVVLTAKTGTDAEALRYAFLDYMANTVITLDQRVDGQRSTRRLRVVKYRGSGFSRNEHPYIIGETGLALLPVSGVELGYQALGPMVPSGIEELDAMLGGGYRRGSAVLISGTSGTGKTILVASFARAAASRGEKVLYIDFEESEAMLVGSVASAGVDLRPALEAGLLRVQATAAESVGVEEHLINAHRLFDAFAPDHVILDAASSSDRLGGAQAAYAYLVRLINLCRNYGRTLLMPNQLSGMESSEAVSGLGISSLVDGVVFLRQHENNGEITRTLLVLKARGAAHSNQAREFRITGSGIAILPPYIGEAGIVTGIARQQQEAREAAEDRRLVRQIAAKEAEIAHLDASLSAQAAVMHASIEQMRAELEALRIEQEERTRGRQVRLGIRLTERAGGKTGDV